MEKHYILVIECKLRKTMEKQGDSVQTFVTVGLERAHLRHSFEHGSLNTNNGALQLVAHRGTITIGISDWKGK